MCFILQGAKITIEPNEDRNLEGLRKVLLQGTPQQIEYAKGLIQEKVEQVKVSKKFKSTSRRGKVPNGLIYQVTFFHHVLYGTD